MFVLQIVVYFFLLAFLILFYVIAPSDNMDKGIMTGLLLIATIAVLFFIFKKEKNKEQKGQYLKHSTLALVGIAVVFFQYPLDYVLGNINGSNMFIWVNKHIVIRSLTISVIGLICFLLGYFLYRRRPKMMRKQIALPIKVNILNVLAAIVLLIYFLTVNPLYLAGYYGAVQIGANASYAIMFFQLFIFASVIQKCRNMLLLNNIPSSFKQYLRRIGWPLIVMISIYLLSVLISGDRGPLIDYSLLVFSGYYVVTKKKLALKYAILLIFSGASVITLLGMARSLNRSLSLADRIEQSISNNSATNKSIFPQTLELAGSIKTLNTAVDYVPEKHGFFYGRFQFQQIAQTIPFFSIFYPLIFNDKTTRYVRYDNSGSGGNRYSSSATYITWIRRGDFPTSGDGTSCMTDFYLDFGLVGVIAGMFLFGYLMRFSEINMYTTYIPGLFIHVFCIVYLCAALYIARGTLFADLKTVVWIYVILLFNKYIVLKLFNR